MSAARAEVSAVVISNEPTNAPVRDFAIITSSLWPALGCPALAWAARPIWTARPKRVLIFGRRTPPYAPPHRGRRGEGVRRSLCRRPLQAEHVEHRGRGGVPQLGQILQDVDRLPRTHQHGDVLLAVHRITDRWCIDAGPSVEAPHLLQGLGVVRR